MRSQSFAPRTDGINRVRSRGGRLRKAVPRSLVPGDHLAVVPHGVRSAPVYVIGVVGQLVVIVTTGVCFSALAPNVKFGGVKVTVGGASPPGAGVAITVFVSGVGPIFQQIAALPSELVRVNAVAANVPQVVVPGL